MPDQLGKQWKNQTHVPSKTAEQAQEEMTRGVSFSSKPGAVPLTVYLSGRGIKDPVRLAMMKSHVPSGVTAATPEDWAKIFADF